MIEDPPLLVIDAGFARPAPALVAALDGAATGHVVDAQGGSGALDWTIKPLPGFEGRTLVGPALTCQAGPADNLAVFGALEAARPGDVVVIATDGHRGCAVIGDLLIGMLRNKGVAGVVTDGLARDLAGIVEVGLPVYAGGLGPNSPARNGPGTVGRPVDLGGRRVASGDIVVADRDGVVIVAREEADQVVTRLAEIRRAEAALTREVAGGLTTPSFMAELLASARVRRL